MKKTTYLKLFIMIFILSLIPIYFIGNYNHPSVDDYYYGVSTSTVWNDTHSVKSVICESYRLMKETYNDWQGNFSAIFLMRLQPGIFGEQYYALSSVILLTFFITSMLTFFYVSLRKWFKASRFLSLFTGLVITFCAMQFVYVPSDSFYWFNGSIYYTFFFSLMLFLFTLVTVMIRSPKNSAVIISFIVSLPLAFFIGGGNYATALFTALVMLIICIAGIWKKDYRIFLPGIMFFFLLTGFLISIKAPGNAIRQAAAGESSGVIKALAYSFAYGAYNIASSLNTPMIFVWIALLPVFGKIAAGTKFKYRYPFLVLLFTYGVFCSQGTPVFYAQGLRMPYRMMNIIYFCSYIFISFNLVYLMGWLQCRFKNNAALNFVLSLYSPKKRNITCAVVTICFLAACVGMCSVTEKEDGGARFSGLPLSASTTLSLVTGEAKGYDEEINERVEFLTTTDESDVTLAPLTNTPEAIFHTDITTDAAHWKNAHMALFYNKNTIRLTE